MLLSEGLENGKKIWRHFDDLLSVDVICDSLKFFCVVVNFEDHKLAKSRNFRSLSHKKDQNYPIFCLFSYV